MRGSQVEPEVPLPWTRCAGLAPAAAGWAPPRGSAAASTVPSQPGVARFLELNGRTELGPGGSRRLERDMSSGRMTAGRYACRRRHGDTPRRGMHDYHYY